MHVVRLADIEIDSIARAKALRHTVSIGAQGFSLDDVIDFRRSRMAMKADWHLSVTETSDGYRADVVVNYPMANVSHLRDLGAGLIGILIREFSHFLDVEYLHLCLL